MTFTLKVSGVNFLLSSSSQCSKTTCRHVWLLNLEPRTNHSPLRAQVAFTQRR